MQTPVQTVQLDLWHVVLLGSMLIGAFLTIAKLLLQQTKREIDEKFRGLQEHLKAQDAQSRHLERQINDLRAELPRDYVRREDYTQAIATIMTKIDSVAMRVERSYQELLERFIGGKVRD